MAREEPQEDQVGARSREPHARGGFRRTNHGARNPLRIFLNYRHEDTGGHAISLHDLLAQRFGEDHVFMDIDNIEPGLDFREVIEREVGSCDVLIALIGKHWFTVTDSEGRRRIDDPNDFVANEIRSALDREIRVIPALVEGATPMTADKLPASLEKLAWRHAFELHVQSWKADVDRLVESLEQVARHEGRVVSSRRPRLRKREHREPFSRRLVFGIVGGTIALVTIALVLMMLATSRPGLSISKGPSATVSKTTVTFEFSASGEDRVDCSLDAAPASPCSSPKTYEGLLDGSHTFVLRALDASGNVVSRATRPFVVTTEYPNPAESDLLARLNPDLHLQCARYERQREFFPAADSVLRCTTSNLAAFITHFRTADALAAAYDSFLTVVGVSKNVGSQCPANVPTEATWSFSSKGTTLGRSVCVHYQAQSWFAWTYDDFGILAEAAWNNVNDAALADWWSKSVFVGS